MPVPSIRWLALLGVTCISFTAVFVRLAGTSPPTTTVFRTLYAIPLLFVIWWRGRARDDRPLRTRLIAGAAGLFLAADLTVWHISIADIGAGLATVLANIQVVFVGVIAWVLYKERPTRLALVVVPVIFGGVVLLSGLGRADAYGDNPWSGVAFGVIAGFFYSLFILTLRASNRHHLVPTAGPVLDATIGAAIGGLIVAAFATDFSSSITWPAHGWLLAIAVVSQSVGWLMITVALPRLPALETSVIILAQPMLTIVWARLIFGEQMSNLQWGGVGLVLGGLLLLTTKGTAGRADPKVERPDDAGVTAP